MNPSRAELETLSRDALMDRAETLRVPRARILTRFELVDEILKATAPRGDLDLVQRSRGFLGKARDLLARVVERGLNLPDAADRIRAAGLPLPPPPRAVPPVPTVTLAEIYAAQGHVERAEETLRSVLAEEPEHAAARVALRRLAGPRGGGAGGPQPPEADASPPAPVAKPVPVAAVARRSAPDAPPDDIVSSYCVAIPTGPGAFFVAYGLAPRMGRSLAGADVLLRVLVVLPSWEGPRVQVRDLPLPAGVGEVPTGHVRLEGLPPAGVVRVAVGVLASGVFTPWAHSPALEAVEAGGSGAPLFRRTLGDLQPVGDLDPDSRRISRARKASQELAREDAGPSPACHTPALTTGPWHASW